MFHVGDSVRLKKALPRDVTPRGEQELREDWSDRVFTVYRVEKDERCPGGFRIAIEAAINGNRMVLLPRDGLWVLATDIKEDGIYKEWDSSCCTIRADLFEKAE